MAQRRQRKSVNGNDFIVIHHISHHKEPIHARQFNDYETPPDDNYSKVVFGAADPVTLTNSRWSDRQYVHSYKVPKKAIMPVVYNDDMTYRHPDTFPDTSPERGKGGTPSLFETIPLRVKDVVDTGAVHQYRNTVEGLPGQLSYVMPIHNMEKLGIQWMGVRDRKEVVPPLHTDTGGKPYKYIDKRGYEKPWDSSKPLHPDIPKRIVEHHPESVKKPAAKKAAISPELSESIKNYRIQ